MNNEGVPPASDTRADHGVKDASAHSTEELCSYCEFKLDPLYIRMHCHVCKDFSLCLNCYLSQAEYKTHNHTHLMYPRTAFNVVAWPDGWTISDDLSLIEAIEINGIGSWDAVRKFMHRPPDEPLEAIIRHFNHIFSNDGIMGAPVLETLVDEEQERAFLEGLPDLTLLQSYNEAMNSFGLHVWNEIRAISDYSARADDQQEQKEQPQHAQSFHKAVNDQFPAVTTATGLIVQRPPPMLDLTKMATWPGQSTPDITAAIVEYLRDPPHKEYQNISKGFKTVPQSVYDDVMSELPDNYSTIFKDFILEEGTRDLGLMTPDVYSYPQGTELKDIPHSSGEGDGRKFLYGSWPLRKDFNVEYVNKAEYPLMFMRICYGRETKLSMQLKVRTLQAYVVRLVEREKRKRFVFQFSLHRTDFAIDESTLAMDEETIRRQGRESEFSLPLKLSEYNSTDILLNKFEANHSWLLRAFSTRLEFRQFATLHLQESELRRYIHTLQLARFLGLRTRDQLIDVDVFMRNPIFYAEQYGAQNELRRRLPSFLCTLSTDNKDKSGTAASNGAFFENPGQRQSILEGICMSTYLQEELRTIAILNRQVDSEQQFVYFTTKDAGKIHADMIYLSDHTSSTKYLPRVVVDVDPGTNTGVHVEIEKPISNTQASLHKAVDGRFGLSGLWYMVCKDAVLQPLEHTEDLLTLDHVLTYLFKYYGGCELMGKGITNLGSDTLTYRTIDLIYKLFCISKSSTESITSSRLSCGAILTIHMVSLSLLSIMSAIAYNNSFIQSIFNDEVAKYLQQREAIDSKQLASQSEAQVSDADQSTVQERAESDPQTQKDVLGDTSPLSSHKKDLLSETASYSPVKPLQNEPPLKKICDTNPMPSSLIESSLQRKFGTLAQAKPPIANTVIMDVNAHQNVLLTLFPWIADIFLKNKFSHDSKRSATLSTQMPPQIVYQAFIQWLLTIMSKNLGIFPNEQQTQHENILYTQIGGAQASVLQMLVNTFKGSDNLQQLLQSFITSFSDPAADTLSADIALQEAMCATGPIFEHTLCQYRELLSTSTSYEDFSASKLLGNVTFTTTKMDRLTFNNVHVFSTLSFYLQMAPISSLLGSILSILMPYTIMAYGLKSPFVSGVVKLLADRRYDITLEANMNAPGDMTLAELGSLGNSAWLRKYQKMEIPEGTMTGFLASTKPDAEISVQKQALLAGKDVSFWLPTSAYGLFVSSVTETHRKKIFEAYHQASCAIVCTDLESHFKEKNAYMFFGTFNHNTPQSYAIPYEMCTINLWLSLKYLPSVADTDAPYHKAPHKFKKTANKCANINPVTVMMSEYQTAKLTKAEYRDLRIRLCTTDRKVVLYSLRDYSRHMFFKICDALLTLTQQKLNILAEQNRHLLANDPFYRDQANIRQTKRTTPGQAGRNITDAFNHSNIALITSQFNSLTEHEHFLLRYDNPCDVPRGTNESSTKSRVISEKLKMQGLDPAMHYIIEPKEYLFGPVMPRKSCIQADVQNKTPAILPLNMRARIVKPHQMRYLHSISANCNDLMSHNEFCSRYLTRGEVIFLALSEIDLETYLFAKEAFIASGYIITRAIFSIFDCRPGACEIMAILVISALCSQSAYSTVPLISSFDGNKIDYSIEWAHCTPYHLFIHTLGERQAKDDAVATEVTAHTDIRLRYGNREITTISNLRLPKFRFEPNIVSIDSLNVPITLLQKADEVIDKDSLDKLIRSYRSIFLQSHFNQDYRLANSSSLGMPLHDQQSLGTGLPSGQHIPSTFQPRRNYIKSVPRVNAQTQTDLSFWFDEKAKRVQKQSSLSKPATTQVPVTMSGPSVVRTAQPQDHARSALMPQSVTPVHMAPIQQSTSLALVPPLQSLPSGQAPRVLDGPLPATLPRTAPDIPTHSSIQPNIGSHIPPPTSRNVFPFPSLSSLPSQAQSNSYIYQTYLGISPRSTPHIHPPPPPHVTGNNGPPAPMSGGPSQRSYNSLNLPANQG